jgi:WD40 repeat protein/serine/threonine protein kinase
MGDRTGQQLGNYRLVRLLGQGGFAEVYLGEHAHLGTQAAIKVLLARMTNEDVEKFRNEARTIARLVHPHIVRVLDFDVEEDGTAFLVMDYAPNGTLRQRHPSGVALAPLTIVPYVQQVAEALQYAHDQKLVHRDIKPENMLLGVNDTVLLSDFGIALIAQSSRYESLKDVAGTVAYMAPEQIQGHPRPASDQYALAVVVYEWLTGARPFQGSYQEIAVQHAAAQPLSLRVRAPAISPVVEEVVMTALAKDPQQRFGNIKAFATALSEASLANQPTMIVTPGAAGVYPTPPASAQPVITPAGPWALNTPPPSLPSGAGYPPAGAAQGWAGATPSQPYIIVQVPSTPAPGQTQPQQKPGVSRRAVLVGGLASLAAFAAGAGFIWWTRSGGLSAAGSHGNSTPGSSSGGQATSLYTYHGHTNLVLAAVWSPDGRRIASASFDQTVQVWDATSGGNVLTYRGHSDQVETVAWSPDGRYLASGGKDNTVQVWDAVTGQLSLTYTSHTGHILGLAWSPNSSQIASASFDKTVRVWSVSDGTTLQLWKGHTDKVQCVAWSPDGQLVASGGYDHTVQVWNPQVGNGLTTYTGHSDVVSSVAWSPDSTRIVSGSNDQTAQVWQARGGQKLYTYLGHSYLVYGVAWSPDGQRIASASADQTARVWGASDGSHVVVYRGHTNVVESVAWAPDSKRVVSASDDTTVQVWQV